MSTKMEDDIKRWTAKRKSALVLDIIQGSGKGQSTSLNSKSRWCEKSGQVSALEHALIARFGTLGRVPVPFLLRSDNGLVFTSGSYTALARGYGLRQGVHHAALPAAKRHG